MPAEVDTVLRRCKAAGMSTDYFWRQIDRDMTNTVTRGEFEEGLKLVRLYLQRTELDALFRWFDKDGSGSVDYQEFMHAMGNKSVPPLGPRWDSSPMPRYRKEEEAAATLSPRVRAPEPAAHGTRRAGQPVELEMAKTWTDVSDLGATVLEHKLVECRKPENASAHARWTSMLRAEAPRAVSQSEKIGSPQWKPPPTAHRVAAHPDGTLELHSKANQPVAAVQARHVESRIRQPVPKNMGRIKEELSSPRAAVPRVRLAHNSQAEMPEQVSLVLQRMKRHGMADCYLFHRMDIDRNDQVSLNEFKKGLRLLHIRLPPDELDTLFSYFDRDKSGRIDYNELQLALRTTNADGSLYPKPAWNIKSPRYAASGHGEFGQMVHSNNNGPL